jgi:hypothetical protein
LLDSSNEFAARLGTSRGGLSGECAVHLFSLWGLVTLKSFIFTAVSIGDSGHGFQGADYTVG